MSKAVAVAEGWQVSERAYTVKEIDALRKACGERVLWGTTKPLAGCVSSDCFAPGETETLTEELVRTHMLAGHTAEDIYAADAEE